MDTPQPTQPLYPNQPEPTTVKHSPMLPLMAGVVLLLVAIAAGVGYFVGMKNQQSIVNRPSGNETLPSEVIPEGIACTMDAKICPDGSAVGRTGPNCEFAACPDETSTAQPTSQEKVGITKKSLNIVSNSEMAGGEYVYSFEYPSNWNITSSTVKHSNDFKEGCEDFILTSPAGTKLNIELICKNWQGTTEPIVGRFEVISDLGVVGNDASQKYIIQYRDSLNTVNKYAYLSVEPETGPSNATEMSPEILIIDPTTNSFIPSRVSVVPKNTSELSLADQIVRSLKLEKK